MGDGASLPRHGSGFPEAASEYQVIFDFGGPQLHARNDQPSALPLVVSKLT